MVKQYFRYDEMKKGENWESILRQKIEFISAKYK